MSIAKLKLVFYATAAWVIVLTSLGKQIVSGINNDLLSGRALEGILRLWETRKTFSLHLAMPLVTTSWDRTRLSRQSLRLIMISGLPRLEVFKA